MIGHRGASGHRPEHTALAYRLAYRQGADSVETDVVLTRDGVLVCRHDLELSRTTDVADRPDLADRRRSLRLRGSSGQGWFVQDLDLAELRTLKARERWPVKRPGSARFDGQVGVVTLAELLELREAETARAGVDLGVHIELKHAALFESLGRPLHEPLTDLLRRHGLTGAGAPVALMAFEPQVLLAMRHRVDTRQVRLFDKGMPVGRRELDRTRAYAEAVGLHKHLVLPRNARDQVDRAGKTYLTAIDQGLDVLVWTLRSENAHLPAQLRSGRAKRDHGNAGREIEWFLDLGVDGVITDFPDLAAEVRRTRAGSVAL